MIRRQHVSQEVIPNMTWLRRSNCKNCKIAKLQNSNCPIIQTQSFQDESVTGVKILMGLSN